MPKTTPWSSLTIAFGLCLLLASGVAAQSEAPADDGVQIPDLEGLAWYQSSDLTGSEMETTLPEDEVADWAALLDGTGSTFADLEYTYRVAFDPDALPDLGGMATVQVAGADTDSLRSAVIDDIVTQVVRAGSESPVVEESTLGGKDVAIVVMPEGVGLADAIVYANGDTAWALVMTTDLAGPALEQLP